MNYRHAYHAGNFADVLKHAVLARLIDYMKRKDGAFRVIDTHAGIGLYDLASDEAGRTGEWETGIARLLAAPVPAAAAELLAPYLDIVRSLSPEGLRFYPGSPLVARRLLRKQDRLTAIELHPADAALLKANFAGDHQVRVIELDGWLALGAHLPPKEKRGLVLIDPPFEKPDEFDTILKGIAKAYRRWPGGTYAIWYPIKKLDEVTLFRKGLADLGIPGILDIRLTIRAADSEPRLHGCGMAVVNPPYLLEAEMADLLPHLADKLALDDDAGAEAVWLSPAR
ncbi:MAG: 23S rRNA (adenine(2030)-N(6))-methyltransferase RlmJ [Rhizobiaceae bacterium]